ncbi:YesK family protein [Lentibacillus salicampi]|uniref:Sodium:dicarboxylate symporter n=1 Tax=Lentibacillus salicampi TaxID=175306 RepID=A0A4Y9A9U7_9BACI|nr:YesK family protein [Lentibacillus salicampi]TFJ92668.1 hypothetical protein E4U82_10960 [Lentibacillus salicampi]
MDALLLEGWLPIIVAGIVAFAAVIMLGRYSATGTFFITTFTLMLLSLLMLVFSFVIGGWTGMGIGFYSVTIFLGLTAGLFVSVFLKVK